MNGVKRDHLTRYQAFNAPRNTGVAHLGAVILRFGDNTSNWLDDDRAHSQSREGGPPSGVIGGIVCPVTIWCSINRRPRAHIAGRMRML
jgi:hypothetical protein